MQYTNPSTRAHFFIFFTIPSNQPPSFQAALDGNLAYLQLYFFANGSIDAVNSKDGAESPKSYGMKNTTQNLPICHGFFVENGAPKWKGNWKMEIHPYFSTKNHDYGRKGRKGMSPFILSRFFYGVSPCVSCELQGRSALHNACAAGQTEAGKNFSTEEIPVIFGRGWLCWLWCQCHSVTFSRGVAENGWQGIAMTNLWSHCTGFRRIQSIQGFNCTWCWRIPFVSVQEYSLITGIHIM